MSQDKKTSNNLSQADWETGEPRDHERYIWVWRKIIPNSLTAAAIFIGVSSIKFALDKKFKEAVICIIVSGLLDGLDGPVARALKGASRFGAELDSLADYVNFGVSPAIVLYLWKARAFGHVGWVVCLVYAVCMACRLARFNAGVDFNASASTRNFFMGVPAPAGAYLISLPMIYTFVRGSGSFIESKTFIYPYIFIVSFLLVSELPTFSSKMLKRSSLAKMWVRLLIASIAIPLIVLAIINIWLSLLVGQILYFLSFGVSYYMFSVMSRIEHSKFK
eukprot:TRINITY_DN10360_c0_g1_i1.p1 TRINITY_DN10360_c0_g1~~TRINITY_DN10360_c0_g1_i1.p1  ORF type:complete len:277 (+),score=23.42 TRINITY_DN10360_c0_g1_i1:44-874(+)